MKNNLKIFFTNRFVILGLVIVGFIVLQEIFYGNWLPTTETKDTWFYSGIFMVVFSLLVIEPYFSSPKNVITNVIPLLLVFIAIYLEFQIKWVWWLFFSYFLILLTISIFAMALDTKNESENSKRNIWANDLKNIAMFAGQGKVLYSSIFLYFLLSNYLLNEPYTIILLIFWAVVLILNPKTFGNAFWGKNTDKRTDAIGTVFGVQSKQMFLVKLFHDVHNVKKFDIVKF
jgi:hypothetical protein